MIWYMKVITFCLFCQHCSYTNTWICQIQMYFVICGTELRHWSNRIINVVVVFYILDRDVSKGKNGKIWFIKEKRALRNVFTFAVSEWTDFHCIKKRERERKCPCMCVREKEFVSGWESVFVWECVCVCVREVQTKKESNRETSI